MPQASRSRRQVQPRGCSVRPSRAGGQPPSGVVRAGMPIPITLLIEQMIARNGIAITDSPQRFPLARLDSRDELRCTKALIESVPFSIPFTKPDAMVLKHPSLDRACYQRKSVLAQHF